MFFVTVIVAAMAFAIVQPIKVLPRLRLAPGYALVDAHGDVTTSEDARGVVTLYTFVPTACDAECASVNATMAEVQERVNDDVAFEGTSFQLITIAIDSPADSDLAAAVTAAGADGQQWRWVTGDRTTVKSVVGTGFGRFYEIDDATGNVSFDAAFVLVDGWGVVRGEYRYQTISSDADKIVNHVGILADEVRHAGGAASVAYEAAHLFLCYP